MKVLPMHWILLAIIVAVACVYLFKQFGGGKTLSSGDMAALLQHNPKVIDVRTVAEYQSGHLTNAINIPLAELDREISRYAPDKGQPTLLHCASGMRSAEGKKMLEQLGYTNVHNLGSYSRAQVLLQKAR